METRAVQTYVTVPLSKLRGYLNKNASIEDVNYIEVTDVIRQRDQSARKNTERER